MASSARPALGGWRTTYGLPFVIGASSAGTIIEWYDFYLYATLTPFLAPLFFPNDNPTAQLLSAFAAYAAGFLVRPFGAVVFGRIGDVIGRKYAFLLTISIMGGATVIVGLLPTHAQIGILAPIILVALRLAQGLALGGEYGGAAIYVAEHAPDHRRGFYTSWIQTTATVGFFLALAIILVFRLNMNAADFASFGWRIPFLISAVLLGMALFIRMRLQETPLFARLKAAGQTTKTTSTWAKDSFSGRKIGTIALVLLGLTAGQGVVWYQGQFQANFFMITYLKLSFVQSYTVMLWAVALGTPFFLVFGALSDKIGRKVIILGGCLIAAVSYWPIYHLMYQAANVTVDPTTKVITKADPNMLALVGLVWIQVIFVTMVYGPIAAFLVEYFRAKVRYTSLSIPYHFGNGLVRRTPSAVLHRPRRCLLPRGQQVLRAAVHQLHGAADQDRYQPPRVQPGERPERQHLPGPRLRDHRRAHDGRHRHLVPQGAEEREDLGRGRRRGRRSRRAVGGTRGLTGSHTDRNDRQGAAQAAP